MIFTLYEVLLNVDKQFGLYETQRGEYMKLKWSQNREARHKATRGESDGTAYSTLWDVRPLGERRVVLQAEVCERGTPDERGCFSDRRLFRLSSTRCQHF